MKIKLNIAIVSLETDRDRWKRALSRLRKVDRKKGIKKDYLLHKETIKQLNQAIKILLEVKK